MRKNYVTMLCLAMMLVACGQCVTEGRFFCYIVIQYRLSV